MDRSLKRLSLVLEEGNAVSNQSIDLNATVGESQHGLAEHGMHLIGEQSTSNARRSENNQNAELAAINEPEIDLDNAMQPKNASSSINLNAAMVELQQLSSQYAVSEREESGSQNSELNDTLDDYEKEMQSIE